MTDGRFDRSRWVFVALGTATALATVVAVAMLISQPHDFREETPSPMSSLAPSQIGPAPTVSSTMPQLTPSASPSDATGATSSPGGSRAELEIAMRHGTVETLEYVVGFARGAAGRVAAVNVRDDAQVPASASWSGRGAIFLEAEDGSWELAETGTAFYDVRFTALLSPPGRPMVLYGSAADGQRPREVTGAWTSTDGRAWTEVEGVPVGGVIGKGPLGYLQARVWPTSTGASTLELYLSDDALSWELVHAVDADPDNFVRAVGGGPEGFVVVAEGERDEAPLILASGDGRTWFEAPAQPALTDDDIVMTIAPLGPDWVAAGWRSVSGPAAGIDLWWSADGLRWEMAGSIAAPEDIEPFGTRVMYPSHLLSRGDLLFLSGARAVEGSETRPLGVWTSTDGRSWTEFDLAGSAEVRAVDATECCLLLGGRLGTDTGEAVIWRWSPSTR